MGKHSGLYLAALVLVVMLAIAYEKSWLNKWLPASWQKHQKSGFVGAYGRTPEMQNCLAYPGDNMRWPNFNRCTWV